MKRVLVVLVAMMMVQVLQLGMDSLMVKANKFLVWGRSTCLCSLCFCKLRPT